MDELCGILGVLLVVGLIIMLIGHVLWLGVAALFRTITGAPRPNKTLVPCTQCGMLRPEGRPCAECGYSPLVVRPAAAEEDQSQLAMTQVRELRDQGLLDEETCQRVELAFARAKERQAAEAPESVVSVAQADEPAIGEWMAPTRIAPPPLPVRVEPAEPPPPPRAPRRPFSQVLASFMEQKNIRWGELVGALLIIGGSIALVMTFWNEIAQRPALKFSLFTSITAAVFGMGLYTQHRWRLPTTSRGMLLFACVLVPLNFLAVVLQAAAPSGLVTVGGELFSFALFAWLVWLAGKVIAPPGAMALSLGVVGASMCQALVNRFMPGGGAFPTWLPLVLGAAPIAICWGAMGWTIAAARREPGRERASALLTTLALASFAALVPLGLLMHRMGDLADALSRLAPLLSLLGVPALVTGLTLWRVLEDRTLAGLRTAGTAAAVGGAMVMLAGLAAGWPNPGAMLPVALIDCAALTAAAFIFAIPAAHLLALVCLMVAWVLAVQVGLGHVAWETDARTLVRAILEARTGVAMVPLAIAILGGAGVLARLRRMEDSFFYVIVAAGAAAISLALVSVHGLGRVEDHGATWVYAIYAAGALAVAFMTRRPIAMWTGSLLLALAVVQGMVYHWQIGGTLADRWLGAMLAYASMQLAILFGVQASACSFRKDEPSPPRGEHGRAAHATGISATAIAAILIGYLTTTHPAFGPLAGKTLWLAALWAVAAWGMTSHVLFALFQCALTAGAAFDILAATDAPMTSPRTLQFQGIMLAGLSVAWVGLRAALGRLSPLLRTPWSVDRVLTILLAAGVLALGIWGAAEPIARELAQQAASIASTNLDAAARAPLAWVFLAVALLALLLQQRERVSFERLSAIFLVLAGGALLLAGRFETSNSAASAWRWLCAFSLAGGSAIIWMIPPRPREHGWALPLSKATLLAFTIAPIIAVTSYSAAIALAGGDIAGPIAGTLFARMGNSINYLTPLLLTMLVLIGFAIRERSAGFAFSAAMVLNFAVSLGYPLWLIARDIPLGPLQIVTLIQLNALAAGLFAIGWYIARHREDRQQPPLLVLLCGLAVAAIGILQARAVGQVIFNTAAIEPWAIRAGSALGWLAWLAAGAAAILVIVRQHGRITTGLLFSAILAIVGLASTRASGIDGWLGLHTLIAGTAMGSWLILASGWVGRAISGDDETVPAAPAVTLWACVLGTMALLLSLYSHQTLDPHQPWWAISGLLAVSVLCVGLGFWTLKSAWLYPAGILLNVCTGLWWNHQPLAGGPVLWSYVQTHAIILAGCGIGFLLLELFALRPMRQEAVRMGIPAYHHPAAILSVLVLAGLTTITLLVHFGGSGVRPGPLLTWASIAAVTVLFAACLWDERAKYAVGGLYLMVLIAALTALDAFALPNDRLIWIGALVIASYALLAGFAFTQRASLMQAAASAGIPVRSAWASPHCTWLSTATLAQSIAVILAAGWTVDTLDPLYARLAAACAVIGMAVATGMISASPARSRMREASLLIGAIGAVLWAWAWLEPSQWRLLLLNRIVVTMAALAGITAFYAIGMVKLVRRENAWTDAARRLVPLLGGATAIALIAVLAAEATLYDATLVAVTRRGVPMAWWAIGTVAAAFILLCITGILCAAVPGKDPLDLPDRTRTLYVYGAEFMLILLFVHIKLCIPDLLNLGIWNRFWPAILMLLAFAGVGLSELFRRQNRPVLAEPLENSAAFLPILPIATYWLLDGTWAHAQYIPYASVLLIAAVIYATLAFLRGSFFFGLLAALTGNGALWWMLHHTEKLTFLQHPQLWLIPAALSVLAAAQLNRDRLGETQLKSLRYLCLMVIYASSTADIWINGVEKSPGLAMVLAALSVAGVLAGIAWRIQSFLLLGTTFLLVSLLTMVHYATLRLHHNWPWYAAIIILGIGIVALFAAFEKKREDMLRLVEGLKHWEG